MVALLEFLRCFLSNPEVEIPFDGIITLLVFLVGIPALVLQFMAPDVRRVTMEKVTFPTEVRKWGVIALLIIIFFIIIAYIFTPFQQVIWFVMFVLLVGIVAAATIQVQYRYGWREVVVTTLMRTVIEKLHKNSGHLDRGALERLIEVGKQSDSGPDREVVLKAMRDLTTQTCFYKEYKGDALEILIDGLVKMLATRPTAEDIPNYQIAVGILTTILSAGNADQENSLIDQQHAVRALSALGQTFLEINLSVGTDHILMDYEEALGLAVSHHPAMLTDVTQSLLEVGAVALERQHFLFAVATFERLLSIIEENQSSSEAVADLLGLTAHFWKAGDSSNDFAHRRLGRIKKIIKGSFPRALRQAKLHSQMTMRFDTADKLAQMAKDVQGEEQKKKANRKPQEKLESKPKRKTA